ncbi:MAG: hypothetical protein GYA51_17810 [Candidatus Methanofastidiosa archaeon]|nr:hypothetical protein [Candidatus Methanofastidiosa archaeon]
MRQEKALELADSLFEIQRIMRLIEPLIEDGHEEFAEFSNSLDSILNNIFPTYTVAFCGPVNSGKSTLLSSVLREGGDHPIASIGPSNETFAPMTISYSKTPSLLVRYFSIEVLQNINSHLAALEKQGTEKHQIALYRELRNTLQKIEPLTASDVGTGIFRKIDLSKKTRDEIIKIVRKHISQSSGENEVYGVYRAELAYPGSVLRDLNNAKFVDLFGFGEPNPLINLKYTRFISEEPLDAVIYVFPDRAITEDFYKLFEIQSFLENIVAKKRLFLVLNKADAYTDVTSAHKWAETKEMFKINLIRHVPILKKYIENIPIFILSAASIDGHISHKNEKSIRDESLKNLHALRDNLKSLSRQLEQTSSDPSIYLSSIYDLLEIIDLFAVGAKKKLMTIENELPEISKIIDKISANEIVFNKKKAGIQKTFRESLQEELEAHLAKIDYQNIVRLVPSQYDYGDPAPLFRAMIDSSHKCILQVYSRALENIFQNLATFIDQNLIAAYREYVNMQDDAIQKDFTKLLYKATSIDRPMGKTVEFGVENLLHISKTTAVQYTGKELLSRFAGWYLRNRCIFNAERGISFNDLYQQIFENVQKTIETFMRVFVTEEPKLLASYKSQICPAGEMTYWQLINNHIARLDLVLYNQTETTKWRYGLYRNKIFFVSNKSEFDLYVNDLLAKRDKTQKLIFDLL